MLALPWDIPGLRLTVTPEITWRFGRGKRIIKVLTFLTKELPMRIFKSLAVVLCVGPMSIALVLKALILYLFLLVQSSILAIVSLRLLWITCAKQEL